MLQPPSANTSLVFCLSWPLELHQAKSHLKAMKTNSKLQLAEGVSMAWWQGPFHPQSHHRVILGKYHKHRLTQHMSTNKSHFYLFKRLGFMSAFISLKNNKVALCFKKKKRLLYEFDTGFHEAWNEGTHHTVGGAPPGCLGKIRRAFGSGEQHMQSPHCSLSVPLPKAIRQPLALCPFSSSQQPPLQTLPFQAW